jgi:hypothetical protein
MNWVNFAFGGHCAVFLGEWIHIWDMLGWLGVSNIFAFYWGDLHTFNLEMVWIVDLAFGVSFFDSTRPHVIYPGKHT